MLSVERYDHLGVAVRSFKEAIPFFKDVLGGEYLKGGDHPEKGYRWIQFRYPGGAKVELLEPMGDDSFLHSFLDGRGEGPHHITFAVQDLRGTVERLRAQGFEIVKVSLDNPDRQEAFIHPRSAHGVLIQLVESALSEDEEAERHQLDMDTILR